MREETGKAAMENAPRRDRVMIAGSLIIVFALSFLPFLVVRETRISPPTALPVYRALGSAPISAIVVLVLASFVSAMIGAGRRRSAAAAFLSMILILLILWQAGASSSKILEGDLPFARVSLGSGAWISLLGAYMIMSSCRIASLKERSFTFICFSFYAALLMLFLSGQLDSLSFMVEFFNRSSRFWQELSRHLTLSLSAVFLGTVIGFPLGIAAFRKKRTRAIILSVANTLQTIPSLALFGLLIAPLAVASRKIPLLASMGIGGIGWAPALIALTVYSLLPIIRNTLSAFSMIDPSVIESGRGMGMDSLQLFLKVELPIALPVVVTGVRISGVQAIGNTAVAALIGAGGLGQFIFQGLGEAAPDLILLGAIPTVVLALSADGLLRRLSVALRPGGAS